MATLSHASLIWLWVIAGVLAVMSIILFMVQFKVMTGGRYENPDGSVDDIRETPLLFGICLADVVFILPLTLLGVVVLFFDLQVGVFLLSLGALIFFYANLAFTATSLRFRQPKITLMWFVTFPMGILAGLAMLFWVALHFKALFGG